ncbi:MAG: addiction module protein [Victivallaceae bacterium]
MTATAEAIFKEAVQLNPIDRAELIQRLFLSFDKKSNGQLEDNWKSEVEERVSAYEAGKIPADTMENVFERLSKK